MSTAEDRFKKNLLDRLDTLARLQNDQNHILIALFQELTKKKAPKQESQQEIRVSDSRISLILERQKKMASGPP